MSKPLMPKATAVWLVENTALSFDQIADFVGLHELEVQAIADAEVAVGMQGADPIATGELTKKEIDRCQDDENASLKMAKTTLPMPKARGKGARYTPVSKRQDRPDAIAWLLKHHPELSDAQLSRLIGTTKPTIKSVRERSHWNISNIKPQSPVGMGLCIESDLEKVVAIARAKAGTTHVPTAAPPAVQQPEIEPALPTMAPGPMLEPEVMPTVESVFGPSKSTDEDGSDSSNG
ncbi:MAG: DUF1013 domain-containing protein [Magnetovibrio sp.]|nr:DUF1013 domain-containing protein [Magnetovibrio sp.]